MIVTAPKTNAAHVLLHHPEPHKAERIAFLVATGREYSDAEIVRKEHTDSEYVWEVVS